MKKQLNIDKFDISEIGLIKTEAGWDAVVIYDAKDAGGKELYKKRARINFPQGLVNAFVNNIETAIDTLETTPTP